MVFFESLKVLPLLPSEFAWQSLILPTIILCFHAHPQTLSDMSASSTLLLARFPLEVLCGITSFLPFQEDLYRLYLCGNGLLIQKMKSGGVTHLTMALRSTMPLRFLSELSLRPQLVSIVLSLQYDNQAATEIIQRGLSPVLKHLRVTGWSCELLIETSSYIISASTFSSTQSDGAHGFPSKSHGSSHPFIPLCMVHHGGHCYDIKRPWIVSEAYPMLESLHLEREAKRRKSASGVGGQSGSFSSFSSSSRGHQPFSTSIFTRIAFMLGLPSSITSLDCFFEEEFEFDVWRFMPPHVARLSSPLINPLLPYHIHRFQLSHLSSLSLYLTHSSSSSSSTQDTDDLSHAQLRMENSERFTSLRPSSLSEANAALQLSWRNYHLIYTPYYPPCLTKLSLKGERVEKNTDTLLASLPASLTSLSLQAMPTVSLLNLVPPSVTYLSFKTHKYLPQDFALFSLQPSTSSSSQVPSNSYAPTSSLASLFVSSSASAAPESSPSLPLKPLPHIRHLRLHSLLWSSKRNEIDQYGSLAFDYYFPGLEHLTLGKGTAVLSTHHLTHLSGLLSLSASFSAACFKLSNDGQTYPMHSTLPKLRQLTIIGTSISTFESIPRQVRTLYIHEAPRTSASTLHLLPSTLVDLRTWDLVMDAPFISNHLFRQYATLASSPIISLSEESSSFKSPAPFTTTGSSKIEQQNNSTSVRAGLSNLPSIIPFSEIESLSLPTYCRLNREMVEKSDGNFESRFWLIPEVVSSSLKETEIESPIRLHWKTPLPEFRCLKSLTLHRSPTPVSYIISPSSLPMLETLIIHELEPFEMLDLAQFMNLSTLVMQQISSTATPTCPPNLTSLTVQYELKLPLKWLPLPKTMKHISCEYLEHSPKLLLSNLSLLESYSCQVVSEPKHLIKELPTSIIKLSLPFHALVEVDENRFIHLQECIVLHSQSYPLSFKQLLSNYHRLPHSTRKLRSTLWMDEKDLIDAIARAGYGPHELILTDTFDSWVAQSISKLLPLLKEPPRLQMMWDLLPLLSPYLSPKSTFLALNMKNFDLCHPLPSSLTYLKLHAYQRDDGAKDYSFLPPTLLTLITCFAIDEMGVSKLPRSLTHLEMRVASSHYPPNPPLHPPQHPPPPPLSNSFTPSWPPSLTFL